MQSEAGLIEAAFSIDEAAGHGKFEVEFIRDDFDGPEASAARATAEASISIACAP